MILINVVSRRAKQLKSGYKPLIESLERLSAEDMALREIIEGKITYQLDEPVEAEASKVTLPDCPASPSAFRETTRYRLVVYKP